MANADLKRDEIKTSVRADHSHSTDRQTENIIVLCKIHYPPAEDYFFDRIAWMEHSEISHSMRL
jgi:hypothetical protein